MNVSNSYNYQINLNVVSTAITTLTNISQGAIAAGNSVGQLEKSVGKLERCTGVFNQVSEGLESFRSKMENAITPGIKLNDSLAKLSAGTGSTGKELKEIEEYARETAKAFGGTAADNVDTYTQLLAQLSPEIAKVPGALGVMGASVLTTSKMMGNDTAAATEVLTTAMNGFGVSLADPMQAAREMGVMMNVMAAAAREGGSQLPAIRAAIEECGPAAKAAGVSFAEANAAIQLLGQAGWKGTEGGTALRKVLESLSQGDVLPPDVQAQLQAAGVDMNQLANNSLSLAERLQPLQSVMNDSALMAKVFGQENASAATALIGGATTMEGFTSSIQGTNAATEQAQTVMSGYSEKMSRLKARADDLKISLFNFAGGIMPAVNNVANFFQRAASVMSGMNAIATLSEAAWAKAIAKRTKKVWEGITAIAASASGLGFYDGLMMVSIGLTYGFSKALKAVGKAIYSIPIIGWIAAGIAVLIAAFQVLWDKCEGFRQIIFAIWEVIKALFNNISVAVTAVWENIIKPYCMLWWNLIKFIAEGIWSALQWCWDGIMGSLQALGNFFAGIWNWIQETCGSAIDWIVTAFGKIVEPIKGIFSPIWDFVSGIFNKIGEVAEKFFGWIAGLWDKLFPKDQFKSLGEAAQAGMAKGSESFRESQDKKNRAGLPEGDVAGLTDGMNIPGVIEQVGLTDRTEKSNPGNQAGNPNANRLPQTATAPGMQAMLSTRNQTPATRGQNETIDLNKVKGTGAYGAIVAKQNGQKGTNGTNGPSGQKGLSGQTAATVAAIASTTNNASVNNSVSATATTAAANLPQQAGATAQISPEKQEYASAQKTDHLADIALNVRKIVAGIAILGSLQTVTAATMTGNADNPVYAAAQALPTPLTPDGTAEPMSGMETGNPLLPIPGRRQPGAQGGGINFEKFCESVIIQVPAGTSQEQAEQIYRELMKRINDARA